MCLAVIFKVVFSPLKSSWKLSNFILAFLFSLKSPPPLYLIKNSSFMHFASVWHFFPQPPWWSGGDYIRSGLRENKEDDRQMIVFRRLLMTSMSNTKLYAKSCPRWKKSCVRACLGSSVLHICFYYEDSKQTE